MATNLATQELVKQKLAAFEQLQPTFEQCFQFVQQVHGQQRFPTFPVASSVRYLHALWVCECKDRLLSIYKNIERYEGTSCLQLLWRVLEPSVPPGPFAEYLIEGYVELTAPEHNNPGDVRFVDPPERSDKGTM